MPRGVPLGMDEPRDERRDRGAAGTDGPREKRPPWRLRGLRRAEPLGRPVPVASRRRAKLLGLALLRRDRAGPGLLFPRCRSVHTFGMRFALTVVFLDQRGRVVSRRESVPPQRIVVERRAREVLELPVEAPAGTRGSGGRPERAPDSG